MENRRELPAHIPTGAQKLWSKKQLSEKLQISIEEINEAIQRIPVR